MSNENIPENLFYSKDHEWIDLSKAPYRIGITHYAQDQLGDIVFLEAPETGKEVSKGNVLSSVESVKSVSDIFSPISGKIEQVNEALETEPDILNRDPYGEGWICALSSGSIDEDKEGLLTPAQYRSLVIGE